MSAPKPQNNESVTECESCKKDIRSIRIHKGIHNMPISEKETTLCFECYGYFAKRWHAAFPNECSKEICFDKKHWTLGD